MGRAVGWRRTDAQARIPKSEGASARILQPSPSPSTTDLRIQSNDEPRDIPPCRAQATAGVGRKKDPEKGALKLALVDVDRAEPAWSPG